MTEVFSKVIRWSLGPWDLVIHWRSSAWNFTRPDIATLSRAFWYTRIGWSMKQLKYLVMAFLVIPALLILAFGPSSNPPVPKGRVVVDYWEKWTADEEKAMRVIVNDFNNSQDRIYVRYVSTSNVNQKTLVATAAGVPPDVAGLWDANLVQFASLDALLPLDDFAAHAAPPITAATYKPVYWNACHYNGHLYALVSTPMAVALHYNTDEFREVGLDPEKPPQTLAELDADAQKLDKFDSQGHLARAGLLPTVPGWYVNDTYFWFGGSIWDAEHHKFTLTDPRVVASFQWIQDYSKRLDKIDKDAVNEFQSSSGNFDSPQNPWLTGALTMTAQGPWMAFYVLNLNPEMSGLKNAADDDVNLPLAERRRRMHWAAAPFPSAVPGVKDCTYCAFDTLVIPRGSKHPSEAFEFINYVNQQKVMEKLCNSQCKNSPLAAVSERFLQHHRNPCIDVFEKLSMSPNAHGTPQIPIYPEVDAELTVLVQKLALLDGEPGPELQALQDRLQTRYDQFMEKQRARKKASPVQ
jgi:ABC-type glycerol-3-phosphate transport system substrate-binding protein